MATDASPTYLPGVGWRKPMLSKVVKIGALAVLSTIISGCATERSQVLAVPAVQAASKPYQGVRSPISVGKFDNRTNYLRGVFSDGVDRLGGQAKTIVISHLQRSGRFQVMDRENLSELAQEAGFNKKANQIKGARYVVTGDVTAFGRKVTGDQQLFGILGRGKEQVAYAKVDLNVVDVSTSEVVYSASGAGEYSLSNREVIGFGGTASYDSTLNGKVLDLAIREAVDRLVDGIEQGAWQPSAN
jgi:curli biogenesis system outer membrane secretion channel CsgG